MPAEHKHAPTHHHGVFRLRYGHPLPFGASIVPAGINFSVFSSNATGCTLILFEKGAQRPFAEIPFPPEFRMGDVFAMMVFDLDPEKIEYGYRMDGPFNPHAGHRFDPRHILLDPYARAVSGREAFRGPVKERDIFPHRGRIPANNFDWEHDRPLDLPVSELVIYELHVRGFTRHASSGVANPGTFDGLREKIPYLRDLGINCVELMPVFEFNEHENTRQNPDTGEHLHNYWGYSTLAFRAPKAGYAATAAAGGEVNEMKELVKAFHAAGIQVVLDVVFNHTAEGDATGPVISFRGLDNKTYYLLAPNGDYLNFSGCGNTLDCNHPVVRDFVIDCLRYWAAEYHIDGFRFDLASVLGRDSQGHPLPNPPLLESIAHDPVLAHCELIAEAWDAGGLYQVGNFPNYGRWMEWNGKFRDAARRFLRGDDDSVGEMVQRIMGSPDLYQPSGRRPSASVNFITCHDGFTLADLFAYSEKRNRENGEEGLDGGDENLSWNCGAEGPTEDPEIRALRLRCAKNAMTLLLVSQGVPMLYMGDEMGRTQRGNNNPYCHDAEWNWLDWKLAETDTGLRRFVKMLIAFRHSHASLHRDEWFTGTDNIGSGYPDISWHGVNPGQPDWGCHSHSLAFMICGQHDHAIGGSGEFFYAAFNMHSEDLDFDLPSLPARWSWHLMADTARPSPDDIREPAQAPLLGDRNRITLRAKSAVLCIGKEVG
ncbi:MAG: glycogen debranching protein GlgX [Chthoniobacterales bacterium]|nr:glycogen debranching protein GlgX [Chthoniobacterales bacterium]